MVAGRLKGTHVMSRRMAASFEETCASEWTVERSGEPVAQEQGHQTVAALSPPRIGVARRRVWRGVGFVCVGLAAVGVVLPLLPTVPFLLLAAWAFARSSPEMHAWLYAHPRYGALLRDWHMERAIPRRAKVSAVALLAASWAASALLSGGILVPALTAAAMLPVSVFLLSRPSPRRERGDEPPG